MSTSLAPVGAAFVLALAVGAPAWGEVAGPSAPVPAPVPAPAADVPQPAWVPAPAPAPAADVPPPAWVPVPARSSAMPAPTSAPVSAPTLAAPPATLLPVPIALSLGVRTMIVPSTGYDPFSTNDALTSCALALGVTVAQAGKIALVVGAEWDAGGSSASARAANASLAINRLGLGLAARYYLGSSFYFFAKAEPGAYHVGASVTEPEVSSPLTLDAWTWAFDATAGAGVLLIRTDVGRSSIRFGLTVDLGAGLGGSVAMRFTQNQVNGVPQHPGSVALPDFQPMGFVDKIAAVVVF